MSKQIKIAVYLLFCAGCMAAADDLAIKIDLEQIQETSAKVKLAAQDGDSQAVLVNGRRMLELIPNEPALQAPLYLLLSQAYRVQGDEKKAEDLAHIARKLDPKVESRIGPGRGEGATRADYSATIQTTASTVGAVVSQIEQIRLMKLCLEILKHNMTPPPACGTPNGGQPAFPGAPVGAPPSFPAQPNLSQPPMLAGPMNTSNPPAAPGALLGAPPGPPPSSPFPSQPPTIAPPAFPSAPVGAPNYQTPAAPPAPMPGWGAAPAQPQPMQSMSQPTSQPYGTQPQSYPMAQGMPRANPYAGSQYHPPAGRRRAGEEPVYRVVHDHSRIADADYFDNFCRALLSVSGTDLTFTSSSAEGALVIPVADIVEIRVNSLLGRESGLFHIITREGLYLSLAPESKDRDQARQWIEAIGAKLGLVE